MRSLFAKLQGVRDELGFINNRGAILTSDATLVLLTRLLQVGSGFLLSVVLVRRFGLAAAGDYALAQVVMSTWANFGTVGLLFTLAQSRNPMAKRNTIGIMQSLLMMPVSFPLFAAYGYWVGLDSQEAFAITLLGCGGWFFAQLNILNALLILQGRVKLGFIALVANLIGLIIAATLSHSLASFAAILIGARLVGVFASYISLPQGAVSLGEFLQELRRGAGFLSFDLISSGSDQLLPVIVSYFISRYELGILGLCQQIVGVSDIAGLSLMQAAYPAMVQGARNSVLDNRKRLLIISVLAVLICLGLTVPLAIWFYRVPELLLYVPLLLLTVPARNLHLLGDTLLRAINDTTTLNWIALVRGSTWVGIALFANYGLNGVIIGYLVHAWCFAWLAQVIIRLKLPKECLTLAG